MQAKNTLKQVDNKSLELEVITPQFFELTPKVLNKSAFTQKRREVRWLGMW